MSAPSLPTGNVRPLVPFFIPGGDSVNEALTHYTAPNAPPTSPSAPVALPVREWDHAEGVFRDAYRLVHDTPAISPSRSTDNTPPDFSAQHASPPRLLTPAGIRQARRRSPSRKPRPDTTATVAFASNVTPGNTQSRKSSPRRSTPPRSAQRPPASPPTTFLVSTPPSVLPPSTPTMASPSKKQSSLADELLAESPKAQRFAGSSFEIASPPPSNLPLPAFKRASSPDIIPTRTVSVVNCASSTPADESNQRETAALELRRMLRI